MDDYQRALQDIDNAHVLDSNNAITLQSREMSKGVKMIIKEPCKTITTLMFLNQTMQSFLQRGGNVKKMLNDYQRALKDLIKADLFEPNNAFTLQSRGDVKKMLKDFDKTNFLEPNNSFTLQSHGNVK